MKKSATSPSRAVRLTKIAVNVMRSMGEIIHNGGAPIPPGFPIISDRTPPPLTLRPGSSNMRDGWSMNSKDHGAHTTIGMTISEILRALRLSNVSFVMELVEELNATTSKIIRTNCQRTIDMNVRGENAHTIVSNSANHHVLRQLKFSNCSNPKSERTSQGPMTTKTTVPRRPLLMAASVVGENA
jgi:hypothetical protein